MACVQHYFIHVVFVLGGFWAEAEDMSLTAEAGDQLEIQCSHSNAFYRNKYFCKGDCQDSDVLIRSGEKDPTGKYSLRENGNTFYVTISDLKVDDSGVYWCAVDRVGLDTYNKVVITVTQREVEESNSLLHHKVSSTEKLTYIGASLGTLLLLLVIVVLIFIHHRHRDISKLSVGGEDDNTTYDTPLKSTQKPSQDTVISCSSANQSSESDLLTVQQERDIGLEPICDIYANVQADSVCYSSVHFSKHCVDSHPAETIIYSAVKHTPAHKPSICSND